MIISVMYPKFQKGGSAGSWFLKNVAHITKYTFNDICQLQLLEID